MFIWPRPVHSRSSALSPQYLPRWVIFNTIALLTNRLTILLLQMYATPAIRARLAVTGRRAFTTTRTQMGSPFHYAEGPRTNIPFNPLTKHFFWRYWSFMVVGFGAPFGIAVWQTYKTK
ncbi:unnamed protein product [Penicillium pancosmium]